jgi:REP element-mobilizing transposase RayT
MARLDRLIPELGFRCFAWVLMPNHVHLALQTGPVPLPRLMARLGTGHARFFNHRHERDGHLLQNRYRSRLVEGDRDLLGLVLYIHRNPLRAGLVGGAEELGRFPWCGHGALTGERPPRPFESTGATLRLLAEDPAEAHRSLIRWMQTPPDFEALAGAWLTESREPRVQARRPHGEAASLEDLILSVCDAHGLSREALGAGRRSRRVVAARADLARRATRDLGLASRAVARALGVSDATVSRALAREPRAGSRTGP